MAGKSNKLKTDIAFKKLATGKVTTRLDFSEFDEQFNTFIQNNSNQLFGETIPTTSLPSSYGESDTNKIVQFVSFSLVPVPGTDYDANNYEDNADGLVDDTNNNGYHAFYIQLLSDYQSVTNGASVTHDRVGEDAFINSGILTGSNRTQLVPSSFGNDYSLTLKTSNGSTISLSSDEQELYIDYATGIVFRQDVPNSANTPVQGTGYLYVGNFVDEKIASAGGNLRLDDGTNGITLGAASTASFESGVGGGLTVSSSNDGTNTTLTFELVGVLSGSEQIASEISGAFNEASASIATDIITNADNISTNTTNISTNSTNITTLFNASSSFASDILINASDIASGIYFSGSNGGYSIGLTETASFEDGGAGLSVTTSSPNKIKIGATTDDVTFNNITALGDIIAQNYIVSSSITYMTQSFSSGSTIFGDSDDDTHQFTGSISILHTGSGYGFELSGSSINIDAGSSGSLTLGTHNVGVDIGSPLEITGSGLIVSQSGLPSNHYNMIKIGEIEMVDYTGPNNSFLIDVKYDRAIIISSSNTNIPVANIEANNTKFYDDSGNAIAVFNKNQLTIGNGNATGTVVDASGQLSLLGATDLRLRAGNSAGNNTYGANRHILITDNISDIYNNANGGLLQAVALSDIYPTFYGAVTASAVSSSGDLFANLSQQSYSNTVVYDTATGQFYYTSSAALNDTGDIEADIIQLQASASAGLYLWTGSGIGSSIGLLGTASWNASGNGLSVDFDESTNAFTYTIGGGILSSSEQIAPEISGAFDSVSASIATDITTNTNNISTNTTNISTNSTNITTLFNASSSFASDILTNADNISTNTNNIASGIHFKDSDSGFSFTLTETASFASSGDGLSVNVDSDTVTYTITPSDVINSVNTTISGAFDSVSASIATDIATNVTDISTNASDIINLSQSIVGTANEVEVTSTGASNITIGLPDNVVITGDLTVQGTTTTLSTTNLLVEDKFILLNSGTLGTPSDEGGIVVQTDGDGNGTALYFDDNAGRWIITAKDQVAGTAANVTANITKGTNTMAAVVTVQIDDNAPDHTPFFSTANFSQGQMYVDKSLTGTNDNNIWIYA